MDQSRLVKSVGVTGGVTGQVTLDVKRKVEISLLIPARQAVDSLENTLTQAHAFLSLIYPVNPPSSPRFEIIIITNPRPGDTTDLTESVALELQNRFSGVHVVHHLFPPGKGAALRAGFRASSGRTIFFTDADLPYDLEFFSSALKLLQSGEADLVIGNRRLPESLFDLPVELLAQANQRHRLGVLFNRVSCFLMPMLDTKDSQAGIKAMHRSLAVEAFRRQVCPGFYFDIELLLTARGMGLSVQELPVTHRLSSGKSTVWIAWELTLALSWLIRITVRSNLGAYGSEARLSLPERDYT